MDASLIDDPFPVDRSRLQSLAVIPRKGTDPMLFFQRKGHVPAVPDDVNNKRVRNCFLDARQGQEVIGRGFGPAFNSLFSRHRFHHDAQKVASILAIRHYLLFDLTGFETSFSEQAAVFPSGEQLTAMVRHSQISEARFQQIENLRFGAVDHKVSCR